MFRIRRISTKLLLAVVAAVLVPFVGFAVFVDQQMAQRLSKRVVLHSLQGLATDLAGRIERDVRDRNLDIELWSDLDTARRAIAERDVERSLGRPADPQAWAAVVQDWAGGGEPPPGSEHRLAQTAFFDDCVDLLGVYDLLLLVDASGELVAVNTHVAQTLDRPRVDFDRELLAELFARDYSGYDWFADCMSGQFSNVPRHAREFLPLVDPTPEDPDDDAWMRVPENYELGFAGPVIVRPDGQAQPDVAGVLYVLASWSHFQRRVNEPVLTNVFGGLVGDDQALADRLSGSVYAWIWDADGDTIIAHPELDLYGRSVSRDVGLPQLSAAVQPRAPDELPPVGGLYPEYTFNGKRKNAAFRRCVGHSQGGFGWVVGVGINNEDIFVAVDELRGLLLRATLLVVLVALLWTTVIARRATSPILALREHTRRVAAGDLEARIAVETDDELGELASDFNRMTAELKEQRERVVAAEKDAAWREMARQIAHDIKNPLTPIKLSVDLMRRARAERPEEFDALFDRTTDTILRQVENLREIASDFQALTGASSAEPESVDPAELAREVLDLSAAWAEAQGIRLRVEGQADRVWADRGLLRRVLVNVVSNAIQAMPDGGDLEVRLEAHGPRTRIEVRDTGEGVSEQVRPHLFEPYFTTKSHGTGLGLAIARRVLTEMDGTIELVPGPGGRGTVCRIELPREPAP